jgi:hypothetical protein
VFHGLTAALRAGQAAAETTAANNTRKPILSSQHGDSPFEGEGREYRTNVW